jgi:hypothetical protein
MTAFDFYKPRRIGETINATFTFIRQEFIPLGKSILFIVGPLMLIAAIISNSTFGEQFSPTPEYILSSEYWSNVGLLMFFQMAIYAFMILLINHYILLYVNQDESRFSVQTIFNQSIKGFWKILGITILFTIIISIATMLLIIPGIYLSVSLSLLYAVIIQEKISMKAAFNRSAFLIREYWWFTLGVLILIWIVVFTLQLVFQGPFLIIGFIYGFHDADPDILANYGWWISISTVLSQLANLFYGIFVVATTVHYYSQREKKEAAGLSQKIDALNDAPVTE